MQVIYENSGVKVERCAIAQTRTSSKMELFVVWNGYDFGVFQDDQRDKAIVRANSVAALPVDQRPMARC